MSSDDRIEDLIAGGERNARVMELVGNWCAHARAKRMGGVGMVEEMTGLPISHFAMECDHAPQNGFAAWDFGESALDFYDRNCATCTVRQPVRMPNLSLLVRERDEARKVAAARQQLEEEKAQRALERRSQARQSLRAQVNAVNQSFIDDLDAFDRNYDKVDRTRLAETARLAPDRIDQRFVDLLFDQSGESTSLALVTLDIAAEVAPSERRTILLAQRLFRSGVGGKIAGNVLLNNLGAMKDGEVAALVPAASELASPDHRSFLGGDGPIALPKLLMAMWKERPQAVVAGIDSLLDRRSVAASQLAGRSMRLLIQADSGAAKQFARAAVSRYVRARQLLSDLGEYENLGDMFGAIDLMLTLEPVLVDSILQGLTIGADIHAKRNIAAIYGASWRDRLQNKDIPYPPERLQLGIDRLIWLPSQMFDSEVLRTVSQAFRFPSDEAVALLERHVDKLVAQRLSWMRSSLKRSEEKAKLRRSCSRWKGATCDRPPTT